MSDKNILGDKVKERRIHLNLTQDELAERMDYKSRTSIAKIETGRPCTQKVIIKLAKALETTPAYLMGWEDNLTDDNAELSVRMLQRTDIIDIVKILMNHDTTFASEVRRYIEFLEIKAK